MRSENFLYFARKMLAADEGDRRYPYDDATGRPARGESGNISIGIGRNLEAKPLSTAVVDLLFKEDISEAEKVCEKIYGTSYFYSLSEPRQLALLNLAFNMGEGNETRGTGLRSLVTTNSLIKSKKYQEAVKRLLRTKYAQQVKDRAKRVAFMIEFDKIHSYYLD